MKSVRQKDLKKRNNVYKSELTTFMLKNLSINNRLKNSIRLNITLKLFNLSLNNFKTRIVNRCISTNRKSKINKNFRFSRLFFLRLARNGQIYGLKKSSW